jgi:multicomponent Na+:H+ antiporter subunit D
LPDAYTHAPAPVTALLAPIGTKAAAYVLARTMLHVIRPENVPVGMLLGWAGALAVVFGGVQALRQTDARRLLAYSSVGQVGYIAVGLGAGNAAALSGAYLHILAHALAKAALFLAVGAAAGAGRGVGVGALGRSMPVTSACAVVAALSMVGVPPSAGFFSKWYLLEGAVQAGDPVLVASVLAGSLLAAAYMYRLTEQVWMGARRAPAGGRDAPAVVLGGLLVLAAASIAVGLASEPIVTRALVPATAR